jgi:hypothetical protein
VSVLLLFKKIQLIGQRREVGWVGKKREIEESQCHGSTELAEV